MSKKDAKCYVQNIIRLQGLCSDCKHFERGCEPIGEGCPDDKNFIFKKQAFKVFLKKIKKELDK